MIIFAILLFILGYTLIALEHQMKINKTAIALILGILLWIVYIFSGTNNIIQADPGSFREYLAANPSFSRLSPAEQVIKYVVNLEVVEHLGDVAEILFYLLGAMAIVEWIDLHHGFDAITRHIHTRKKKKLLWLVTLLSFFMSSVLDNMTSAIVMITLIQKLLNNARERWLFGSIIVIAANAGGAWTPIGDVTTIMLWINDNITSQDVMKALFLPSIASVALPVWLLSFSLKGQLQTSAISGSNTTTYLLDNRTRNTILILGVACLLSVPVFKSFTNLPPFMGILFALGIIWVYTEILYNRQKNIPAEQQYRFPYVLSKLDIPTILFFFGILMAVAALEAMGILKDLSTFLNDKIHNVYWISIIIGFLSSIIDNVPLVAAAMGMYPVLSPEVATHMPEAAYMSNFVQDGTFWELIAYCAGTGGSILIIGSAAGVVVMGLEKINFTWYLKHISWLAIAGFFAGLGIYYLQKMIF